MTHYSSHSLTHHGHGYGQVYGHGGVQPYDHGDEHDGKEKRLGHHYGGGYNPFWGLLLHTAYRPYYGYGLGYGYGYGWGWPGRYYGRYW